MELDALRRTLLETRIGFNLFSQTIEPNNKIDPQSLGINTGPLDAEDLGVPGVTTPFGHIGGVGGYPITTKPTTTTQISVALTQTRGSHTFKVGAMWDYAYNRSVRNQARTTLTANGRHQQRRRCARRPAARPVRERGAIVRPDRAAHEPDARSACSSTTIGRSRRGSR